MGSFLSRIFWRKREKSTYQQLEEIEIKLKEIEEFSGQYQIKQKRFVGNLLLYGIGSSVIAFLAFYFAFLPKSTEKRIIYSIPVLLLPIFIFLLKNLVAWYFQRKVNSNSEQLAELRTKKRDLLDQVKNKETYKDAIEILQRFGGNDRSFSTPSRAPQMTPTPSNTPSDRKMINTSTFMTPTTAFKTPAVRQLGNVNANINTLQQRLNAQPTPIGHNRSFISSTSSVPIIKSNTRTPYPIIDNSQKTVVDKMVDYLIGDGPTNRFAMICQNCYKHNGMALQEEYEYAAFRCAFCNFFNPAKKLRPTAPRLPSEINPSVSIQRPSTSSESSSDSSDIEVERMKKPQNVTTTLDSSNLEPTPSAPTKQSDIESESANEDIEILEKPERTDIEKKLE
ncbi:CLUMA_CG003410, isoform A [Clunio marinus]|uniref:Endoplasmic reticulum junction formation protein lunapark n=1 Tax=Clunio marinus TaxID=568069 RepID=A0A1J1HTK2_9DIPT|nr:CLUMA_CG003410, isoform A [Clunio marinus]